MEKRTEQQWTALFDATVTSIIVADVQTTISETTPSIPSSVRQSEEPTSL